MVQTILIPTDFSIASIQVLKEYLNTRHTEGKINVVFAAGYDKGDSITDLLFYSKQKLVRKLDLTAFEEALNIVENKYDAIIENIKIEFFSGWNKSAFNNFLEGNKIDRIVYSNDFRLKSKQKDWFDIVPHIQKSKTEQVTIAIESDIEYVNDFGALSSLFSTRIS